MTENTGYKSGFVAIVGRPNVGKSTLMNTILGERIAITTPKPQTTRNRILGVHHTDDGQIVFLDTPGVHKAKGGLNRYMINTALDTIGEADLVFFMVEAGPKFIDRQDLGEGNKLIIKEIARSKKNCFLIVNKVDLIAKERLLPFIGRIKDLYDFKEVFPISAKKNDGVSQLVDTIWQFIPEGPAYYPDDMVTDRTMRFIASEIIREKTLILLREEVPYSVGIVIDKFKELDSGKRYHIEAIIHVERESQKGIVIGKQGQTLKTIGERARKEMEKYFRLDVGLKLLVRVKKDWTSNPGLLKEMGYE